MAPEKWPSMWSSKKYMVGKIIYQKDPMSADFFSRGYSMEGDALELSSTETRLEQGTLLPESLKDLHDCSDLENARD